MRYKSRNLQSGSSDVRFFLDLVERLWNLSIGFACSRLTDTGPLMKGGGMKSEIGE